MSTQPTFNPNPQPAAPQGDDWFEQQEQPASQAPPQPPAHSDYFLKADTGTVYKTAEEAAKGVAEKDRMIATQKQQLEQLTRVAQAALGGQPQPSAAQQQAALYKALETSVQQGDMTFDQAVRALAEQTSQEQYQKQMQPLQPLIRHANRTQALEIASQQFDPNIRSFYGGTSYQKVLETNSVLRDGINQAEADPRYAGALPELYRMAFQLASLQSAPTAAQPPQQTVPQSTNAPQSTMAGTPQPSPAWDDNPFGPGVRDPFKEAFALVPDIQLSQVDWSKR